MAAGLSSCRTHRLHTLHQPLLALRACPLGDLKVHPAGAGADA